jgi:D-lactate dehydrogenase
MYWMCPEDGNYPLSSSHVWTAQARITEVQKALVAAGLPFGPRVAEPKPLTMYEFKHEVKDYKVYWDVRKGLIPIVGGARETGEVCVMCAASYPVS